MDILYKGGILMIPIFLCSVIGLAIIIERFLYFWTRREDTERFMKDILRAIEEGNIDIALDIATKRHSPVAEVVSATLKTYIDNQDNTDMEKTVKKVGSKELSALETNLQGLNVIAAVSPLLGLLGTVIGMIKAFMQVETHGAGVNVGLLAGGIWEAMITTAAGLCVAIPCLLFYHYFMGKVNKIEILLKNLSSELIETLRKKKWNSQDLKSIQLK